MKIKTDSPKCNNKNYFIRTPSDAIHISILKLSKQKLKTDF